MKNHPIQPINRDQLGDYRFKSNKIIIHLLENYKFPLQYLLDKGFSDNDKEQLTQLLGYSLEYFETLSYISNETHIKVDKLLKEYKIENS